MKVNNFPILSGGRIGKEVDRRIKAKKREKRIEGIIWGIISFGMGLWVCWLASLAYVKWLAGES